MIFNIRRLIYTSCLCQCSIYDLMSVFSLSGNFQQPIWFSKFSFSPYATLYEDQYKHCKRFLTKNNSNKISLARGSSNKGAITVQRYNISTEMCCLFILIFYRWLVTIIKYTNFVSLNYPYGFQDLSFKHGI